jgi:hypothetical protein
MPESKLGPNVAAGIRDVQQSLEWRTATVMRNDAISLDGGQRLLHLSVPDDVSRPLRRPPSPCRGRRDAAASHADQGTRPLRGSGTKGDW